MRLRGIRVGNLLRLKPRLTPCNVLEVDRKRARYPVLIQLHGSDRCMWVAPHSLQKGDG